MLDFSLTDEQKALQKLAHKFAETEMRPVAADIDRNPNPDKSFPWEVIRKALKLGFGTLLVPEKYGGGGGGLHDLSLMLEELAWGDVGMASAISVTARMSRVINLAGTEAQREKWLRAMCEDESGTFLLAGAFTEPGGGTEIMCPMPDPTMGVRTKAVRDGDQYVINGQKCFITNTGVAKLYVVLTRTDKTKPNLQGCTLFLVPAESPGLKIGKIEDKMGMRSGSQGEIFFEDVRVPRQNMLGEENGAFRVVNETFRGNAVGVSSEALGLARAAYEIALQDANERTSWGKLIRQYESTMDKLVQMRTKIEAARAFIWKMAWSIEHPDQSQGLDNLASMIKLFASQLVREVTVDALQILGGYGYMKDFPVEKYVRDAMVTTIRDLTSEFIMIGLAQKL
jgi:alkylation response protein AidB-like acyl-CoA dehydrogenase